MAPARRFLPLLAAGVLATGCTDTVAPPAGPGSNLPVALAVIPELPAYCGASTVTPLIADRVVDVGTVAVHQDATTLYVVYRVRDASRAIQATALFVGSAAEAIPTGGSGNPQVGRFPYRSGHPGTMDVVWAIPLDEVGRGTLVVAAYAALGPQKAGAWGAGEPLSSSGPWASHFTHVVSECAAGTVDEAGGTLALPGEPGQEPSIELEIPEGALDGPVVITIEPASIADLGDAVGSASAATVGAAAAPVNGPGPLAAPPAGTVIPIEGTVWELKPSGKRFNKPITVRIRYAPDNVPEGVNQDDLRIYLLGGDGLEGGFGASDPPNQRVVGEIEHFSYAFVGYEEGVEGSADLQVGAVQLSPSGDLSPGSSLTVTAILGNAGPDEASDVAVRYRLVGDATMAPLDDACAAVDDAPAGTVEAVCAVDALVADASAVPAPAVSFVLATEGTYTVEVEVTSALDDPDLDNNTAEEDVSVVAPDVTADLEVTRIEGTPDPVEAGGSVTWEVDVLASEAVAAVSGATLAIRFQGGGASFVSADAGCSAVTGGVDCLLPALEPDEVQTVSLVMALTDANTVVEAEATVTGPAGLIDPDGNNNSASAQVTVVAPPTGGWVVSDILPSGGQVVSYPFDGLAGQWVRVHASLLNNVSGSARLSLAGPDGTLLYPTLGSSGWATAASSANMAVQLPVAGAHVLRVESAAAGAGYRVGLGTGRGRRDLAFGPIGFGEVTVPRGTDGGFHLTQMTLVGNEILTVGHNKLRRFDASGNPVAGFGVSGAVDLVALLGARGTSLVVQPDGRIVVAARVTGTSPYPWKVARFHPDGSLDASFGSSGVATIPVGNGGVNTTQPVGVALQPNGAGFRIVVAGRANDNLKPVGVARLNPDGTLDATFGTGGVVFEAGLTPLALGVQSDGGVLVMGDEAALRFLPNGVRDPSVGVNGLITWSGLGAPAFARATNLRILSGDRILVVGNSSTDAFAMRLTPSGALDNSFAGTGWTSLDFGLGDRFRDVTEDALGNLVIAGRQTTSGGDREFLVVRLRPTGLLDATFGHAGYILEHRLDDALSVAIDAAGRIVVGGESPGTSTSNGVQLLRLLPQ